METEKQVAGSGEATQHGTVELVASPFNERDQWLDTMADFEISTDRRFKAVNLRIDRLQSRARLMAMPEEVKTLLVLTGVTVAATVLVTCIQGLVEKWRQSR